ncbi:MAG: ABC transporter permease, partial [Fermentimonas sp.]|nr:ABC transporter permease [Fermentimonas sp.]
VKQLRFMLDADLGYNTENVMMCTLMSMPVLDHSSSELMAEYAYKLSNNQQLVKQKMDKSTLFTEWAHGGPLYKSEANYQISLAGKEEYKQVAVDFIDNPNKNMFDFQLVEGRLWDSTDVFYQYKCIINESAMKMFNIKDFSTDYLQFQTRLWTSSRTELDMNINPPYEIVGVIKDFNTGHLSKSTLPMVFVFNDRPNPYSYLMGRFIPGKEKEAATYLEGLHKEINNNAEFKYSLLKDNIAKLYEKDKQVSNVYSIFALMAIFVSCLGLFALSLFDIQQRHSEIGLRKINGATTKDIMYLLLKKYLLLLLSAFLISIPLSYFAIYKYLEGFAYKATISWWLFVISGFIVVGISVITISWQVRKAMKINPVEAFKLIK